MNKRSAASSSALVGSLLQRVMIGAPKFKIGHMIVIMHIWGTVCHPKTNTSYGQPVCKIWSL